MFSILQSFTWENYMYENFLLMKNKSRVLSTNNKGFYYNEEIYRKHGNDRAL